MRSVVSHVVTLAFAIVAGTAAAASAQPAGGATDVYHVHFTKAAPGQAGALGKALMVPDKTAPMPDHFLVLRHQEGDDWDYVVIQHLGQKAAIDATPTPPNPARDMRAWHNDTFVSGPPWEEFARAMAIGGSGTVGNMVYVVGVHRPAPGARRPRRAAEGAEPAGARRCEDPDRQPVLPAPRGRRLGVHDPDPLQLLAGLRRRAGAGGGLTRQRRRVERRSPALGVPP